MLTLNVRQPFAWAIIKGQKPVEYRNWTTQHRGPLLIHSSSNNVYGHSYDGIEAPPSELFYGYIIGAVVLEDIQPNPGGGYAWRLTSPIPFPMPVKYGGRHQLFPFPLATVVQSNPVELIGWLGDLYEKGEQ